MALDNDGPVWNPQPAPVRRDRQNQARSGDATATNISQRDDSFSPSSDRAPTTLTGNPARSSESESLSQKHLSQRKDLMLKHLFEEKALKDKQLAEATELMQRHWAEEKALLQRELTLASTELDSRPETG